MEYFQGILLGVLWIGGILFMRSITTFLHEMGHALPALLFTKKEKVHVLIGTYGDIRNSLQISLGRLVLYLKLNILNWRIGLCAHGEVKQFIPKLIIILGGPLASLLIALSAFYFIINHQLSQGWVIFIVFFLVSAIIDFLVNIDPSHQPIKLFDNTITYSDGYQLRRAFQRKGLPASFYEAEDLLNKGDINAAIDKCEKLIDNSPQKKPVYDLIINAYLAQKEYKKALVFYDHLKVIHQYSYIDFFQIGLLHSNLNNWEAALPYFDHCIYEKHTDGLALVKRGYIYMQTGNYQRAQQDLTAAIAYQPDNPEAWSNRGLLFTKIGHMKASIEDLEYAKSLAPNDPTIHYHLGIYFETQRNYKQALEYYHRAKQLGLTYHGIDLKIADIENLVEAFL